MDIFDFGLRLKQLRESRNMSQEEVAKQLNLKRATISGYECNTKTPSVEILVNLALMFNVSTDYLLGMPNSNTISLDAFSPKEQNAITTVIAVLRDGFKDKNE